MEKTCLAAVIFALSCALAPRAVLAEGMMSRDMPMKHPMAMQPVEDARPLVKLAPETISLLRADMRSMMAAFTTVLSLVGEGKNAEAATVIESELGMSAMASHPGMMKASQELPEDVRSLGMEMHKAASKLAKNLGSIPASGIVKGLGEISAGCVSCHMAYRVR